MIVEFYKCDTCGKAEEVVGSIASNGEWIVIEASNLAQSSNFRLIHQGHQISLDSLHCCSLKCFGEYLSKFPIDMQKKM